MVGSQSILHGLSRRRAKQSNIAQYCDEGSHKGRIPTGSYNILCQGISQGPKHGQYCQDTYDTFVQGISLRTHGQYRTKEINTRVEARGLTILCQGIEAESKHGLNCGSWINQRLKLFRERVYNIVTKESAKGQNNTIFTRRAQYSGQGISRSRNTDNIVDLSTSGNNVVIESEGNQLRSRSKTSGWVVGKSFLKGSNPRNQPKPKHSGTKLKGIEPGNQPKPKHK